MEKEDPFHLHNINELFHLIFAAFDGSVTYIIGS